jgi:hypothetical protein
MMVAKAREIKLEKVNFKNPGAYLQHFNFFVTYKWTQRARVLHQNRLKSLHNAKHVSLLGTFISYVKMKCCEYSPWVCIDNTSFFA